MAKAMRKVRTGSVVSTKMDQTAVVHVPWKQRHPLYGKQVGRISRFYVHDRGNQCQAGDLVRIEETRPISRTKRWRLLEIVQRHQLPEVRPIELEAELEISPTPAEAPTSVPANTGGEPASGDV